MRGITPARHERTVTPNEEDSDPAAQCSEGRCRKILNGGMTTRREVLKIFKYPAHNQSHAITRPPPRFNPYAAMAIAPDPA